MKQRAARSSIAKRLSVRVPASAANLGAGFDCFGLALRLYLHIRACVAPGQPEPCCIEVKGEGSAALPRGAQNLIYRAMECVAEREQFSLPPIFLRLRNEIPLASGLGSSAAAIVAGVLLGPAISGRAVPADRLLRYAAEMEGHADNVAAALLGGWVTVATGEAGALAVRRPWPAEIRAVVVSPDAQVDTHRARALLPEEVRRENAVFNLQRAALFAAALAAKRFDLIWDAMQDRLHQPQRQMLVPGLAEALATPRRRGLLGVALSGSGPSVVALASRRPKQIGDEIAASFRRHGVAATVRVLGIDSAGARVR